MFFFETKDVQDVQHEASDSISAAWGVEDIHKYIDDVDEPVPDVDTKWKNGRLVFCEWDPLHNINWKNTHKITDDEDSSYYFDLLSLR